MATPTSALVLDIETKRTEGLAQTLGMQEHLERLANCEHLDELRELAEEHGIALGNYKNFDPIQRKVREHFSNIIDKAALKLYGASIYCIGVAGLNGGKVRCEVVTESKSEFDVLTDFMSYLADKGPFLLTGFNIRGFDIPVLRYRCMVLGVSWPTWMPSTVREDKWERDCVFDIRDVLDEGNLDTHLRVFGLPPKTGSGAHVADMTPEEVASYCADDVERERRLACRVMASTVYREFLT